MCDADDDNLVPIKNEGNGMLQMENEIYDKPTKAVISESYLIKETSEVHYFPEVVNLAFN